MDPITLIVTALAAGAALGCRMRRQGRSRTPMPG